MRRFGDEVGRKNVHVEGARAVRRLEAEAVEMAERRAAYNAKRTSVGGGESA